MKRAAGYVLIRPSTEIDMPEIPLHSLINHFPIALAVFALLYDGWAVYSRRPEMHDTGYGLSLWAGVLALVSVVTGLQIAGLGGISKGAITGHALYGIATSIVLAAFGLWRYSVRAVQTTVKEEEYSMLWLAVQALAALLVLAAAMTGHGLL